MQENRLVRLPTNSRSNGGMKHVKGEKSTLKFIKENKYIE